jgi:hypothetical protein
LWTKSGGGVDMHAIEAPSAPRHSPSFPGSFVAAWELRLELFSKDARRFIGATSSLNGHVDALQFSLSSPLCHPENLMPHSGSAHGLRDWRRVVTEATDA